MEEAFAVRPGTRPPDRLQRVKGLTYGEFIQRYERPGIPVIIEDAISAWPALEKWTPDFWVERYGDRRVEIDGTPYTLREVIELATCPAEDGPPPYYHGIRIGKEYPELGDDLQPYPSCSSPNWFLSPMFSPLKRSYIGCGEYELFIGGLGRSFPYLHYDFPNSHTFIHQVQGRKLFMMFAPSDAPYLYPKSGRRFQVSRIPDVENVSLDEYPRFRQATRIDTELGPGDTLFMPPGWWHTARMLSFSVSVGIDVANETNWHEVSKFLKIKAKGRLGPLAGVFNCYLDLGAAYLRRTSRVSPDSAAASGPAASKKGRS